MRLTPMVRAILIVTIGAFLVQLVADTFFGAQLLETLALVPARFWGAHAYWQIFTYALMHADLFHILFNMLILWMMGSELEQRWGAKFFLKFYAVCALSAGLFYLSAQVLYMLFSSNRVASYLPLIGSSGAVYGLLVAYGIIFSERTLLFMMIFPMKAKHFVLLLAAIEFISTVFYSRSGVANIAHIGGMVAGFFYLFVQAYMRVRARQPKGQKRVKWRKNHLRLVVNNELFKEFDADEDSDGPGGPDRPTFH